MMTTVHFYTFLPYEDPSEGEMGRFELAEEGVPLNIYIDNAGDYPDLKECDGEVQIYGVAQGLKHFKTEAEYAASGSHMAVQSMIPSGTFATPSHAENFEQSPTIIYSGIVKSVDTNPGASENEPNYFLEIETYGMTFYLYAHTEEEISVGDIVSGGAWIYGDLKVTA